MPILNAYNSKNKIPIIFNKVHIIHDNKEILYDSFSSLFFGNEDKFGIKRGAHLSFVLSLRPVKVITKRRTVIKFICECQRMIIY